MQVDGNPVSSFPGIWKYPIDRNDPLRNGLGWIAGKRKDDNLNGLWRVHDKIYNLESFIEFHHGGSDWLEITRGTDITEAFESAHIVNHRDVEKILAKYFVQNATHPRLSPYTFESNGFFKTLKRRVEPILKEVGTGPTVEIKRMMDVLATSCLVMCFLGTWLDSKLIQVFAGLLLAMTVVGAHNFFHLRDNWRKYYFDLSLLSSYEWRVSHALSHHLFPNTLMDAEVSMFEPLLELLPKKSKNWFQRYAGVVYTHVIYLMLFSVDFSKRWFGILRGNQVIRLENLFVFLELVSFLLVAPSVGRGIQSWFVIHFASSYFFGLCGLNAAHHHPVCFHDGDEARPDPDFGLCQLDAVRERSDGLIQKNLFVILVVFGEHSLHHLFPAVCHSKLQYIKPIFIQTMKEFAENFPALTQWELFLGTLQQLKRIEPNPFRKDKPSLHEKTH